MNEIKISLWNNKSYEVDIYCDDLYHVKPLINRILLVQYLSNDIE